MLACTLDTVYVPSAPMPMTISPTVYRLRCCADASPSRAPPHIPDAPVNDPLGNECSTDSIAHTQTGGSSGNGTLPSAASCDIFLGNNHTSTSLSSLSLDFERYDTIIE